MNLFCAILLEHLLYDFHWQGNFIAENKGKRPFLLFVHCLTWALLIWFTGHIMAGWNGWIFLLLFSTHIASDAWKSRQPEDDVHFYQIYIDQLVHFASLLLAIYFGAAA